MSLIKINYHQLIGPNINSPFSLGGVGFEPELLLNTVSKDSVYFRCPAWKHKATRTFVLKSPVDITLTVHSETNELRSPNLEQWQFDQYCAATFLTDWCTPEKTTIQLNVPKFIFWTTQKNVWIECRPYYKTVVKNNLTAVPGWFNLSAWTRPIGAAFDVIDPSKPIIIKRGDPLLEVCFYSKNLDYGILLKKEEPSPELMKKISQKSAIKEYIKQLSKKFMFKEQKAKCPFEFIWK